MRLSADAVESGNMRRHQPGTDDVKTPTGDGCGYPLDWFRTLDIVVIGASPTVRRQPHDLFGELTRCPARGFTELSPTPQLNRTGVRSR